MPRSGSAGLLAIKEPRSASLFQYPSDLFQPGAEPFVIFSIYDPVARGGKRLGSIATYMPPTLKVRYQTQYEELSLDWEKWGALVGSAASGGLFTTANALGMGSNILDALSGANTGSSVDIKYGRTINPHMALLFRGVGFREFQFDFQMMAKNEKESNAIQNIIYQLKFHMHPGLTADDTNRFYTYPSNFTIDFFTPAEKYMFKIATCALTAMDVDYAGSGVPSFFSKTGAPVDIRMSLTFKELAVVTRELINEKGL